MNPENHEFGVPRWPTQDFRLIETMTTSVAIHIDQTGEHTGPGVPERRGGFKILLAEYIVCVIQYYSDQWCPFKSNILNLNRSENYKAFSFPREIPCLRSPRLNMTI